LIGDALADVGDDGFDGLLADAADLLGSCRQFFVYANICKCRSAVPWFASGTTAK
jgi:hypothetical protein